MQPHYVTYGALLVLLLTVYLISKRSQESRSQDLKKEQEDIGLTEPASLHPVIDPAICMGCAACVVACPEADVIGIIDKKAVLVTPANCIGHGACKTACPVDAITLVFGSEKRGVDIPHVNQDFETNVPGVFIAGELGGMGLIRNAVEQGRQAMESISRYVQSRNAPDPMLDVVIVGAGPAGFSATLGALEKKLKFTTLEQDTLGGTVSSYPRGKIVMTRPAQLPIVGRMHFQETTKEHLMTFWKGVEHQTGVRINYNERVTKVTVHPDGIETLTEKGTYKSKALLLAIGRRGTPRKLNVPGEQLAKVVYKLVDARQYQGQHVLVVGGGDSALEAACALAENPSTTVTLSYRSESFSRAKKKNRDKIEHFAKKGRIKTLMKSVVTEILDTEVLLDHGGQPARVANDAVIVCAGGELPTPFLKDIGIKIDTKYGTA